MKKAVIYARYSCDKQQETSIEGQLDVCYRYAKDNGFEIIREYIDRATSGKSDNRAEYQQMLYDSSKKEFVAVIVYKLDRFARNVYDSVIHEKELNDNGVELLSAMEKFDNQESQSVIYKSIMISFAEYYSKELREKVLRTQKIVRENQGWLGGKVSYGYKVENKKYVIDEEEARKIRALYDGVAKGIPPARLGHQLQIPKDAHLIIKNIIYKGQRIHNGQVIENSMPRIVDDYLWELANSKLTKYEYHAHFKYLLSGKMFCGTCGNAYIGECCTNKMKKKYHYYKPNCKDGSRIRCEQIETEIVEYLKSILTEESIKRIIDKTLKIIDDNSKTNTLNKLESELKSVSRSCNAIVDNIASGDGYNPRLMAKLKEMELKEQELKQEIETIKTRKEITKKNIIEFFDAYLKTDDLDKKILKELVQRVDVFPDYYIITCGYYDNRCSPTTDIGVPKDFAEELLILSNSFKIVLHCSCFH